MISEKTGQSRKEGSENMIDLCNIDYGFLTALIICELLIIALLLVIIFGRPKLSRKFRKRKKEKTPEKPQDDSMLEGINK